MVGLTIDGVPVSVPAGTLVIRAAEQVGVYVPRFCDHPLLDPLGACRQCIVEVEGQRKPLTACTTVVSEGMVVRTQATSPVAADAQSGVLELLLINHPLDCPMCDKGGECPLQDQALAYGTGGSRFVDGKRRFTKPVPISPMIKLDRERCVLCARCTRFSEQIAGEPFIELLERGALEQVAIYEDEPYESVFSGNVVQICPVGALTASTFRFRARPFDMSGEDSTCTRCASGCAITVQERRGEIVRVLGARDLDVNDEWICDKGRFAFGYRGDGARVTEPLVRKGDEFVAVSWSEAIDAVAGHIDSARAAGARSVVLGGERLLDEDAYALSRFARVVVGTNDVDARLGAPAVPTGVLAGAGATYADIDAASTIAVVSADLREESPIVFLRVRKALRRGARVLEIGPRRGPLSGLGATWVPSAPGEEAAALVDLDAGSVVLACDSAGEVGIAAAWNAALSAGARFGWVPRRAGARGALWAGLRGDLLPGGRAVTDPAARTDIETLWNAEISAVPGHATGAGSLVFLVGADPIADGSATASLGASHAVIAIDAFLTPSSSFAHILLPAAVALEREGTVTDWEGRARNVRASVPPAGLSQPDHQIFAQIARAAGVSAFPASLDALRDEMRALPTVGGTPAPVAVPTVAPADGLRAVLARPLLDGGTMMASSGALRESAHTPRVVLHPADAARAGVSTAARVRVAGSIGSFESTVEVSEDAREGTVVVPVPVGDAVRVEAL